MGTGLEKLTLDSHVRSEPFGRGGEVYTMTLTGRCRTILLAPVFLCTLFAATAVGANGPEVAVIDTGASLVPVHSSTIQLLAANVSVVLPNSTDEGRPGQVECDYLLRNPASEPATITMAFVTGDNDPGRSDVVRSYRDSEFAVTAAGDVVPVKVRPILAESWRDIVDSPPDSLPTWELVLPPQGNVRLLISYRVWWSAAKLPADERWQAYFKYNARPAALWAGPIGEARISFAVNGLNSGLLRCLLEGNPCTSANISPPGFEWAYPGVTWRFRDWEPDCDFVITADMHPFD
jgi:hypothetical protein